MKLCYWWDRAGRIGHMHASATKCYSSGTEHGTAYAVVLRLLVARLHLSGDNSRARYIKGP